MVHLVVIVAYLTSLSIIIRGRVVLNLGKHIYIFYKLFTLLNIGITIYTYSLKFAIIVFQTGKLYL